MNTDEYRFTTGVPFSSHAPALRDEEASLPTVKKIVPSPAGEGWGRRIKNKAKSLCEPLILTFYLREKVRFIST